MNNIHIVQLKHARLGRRIGVVNEPGIMLLDNSVTSSYQLVKQVIGGNDSLAAAIPRLSTKELVAYDEIYSGASPWALLPPIDCPENPMMCMLSGTGLTHKASAENRQKMHDGKNESKLTDSMLMYLWGEEGGKPIHGQIGVQPEWFYKGNGLGLKGHREPLVVPAYANDGGEEPEIAGIYFISDAGQPYRIGFAQANEFSDHAMERKNYLYLAPSKIRNCSIGPELVIANDFNSFDGTVSILRHGAEIWSKRIRTGEMAITHSLENLEYHHFKYEQHRQPGQLHVHFFGADAFSFGAGIALQSGDEMKVSFDGMGRSLINTLQIDTGGEHLRPVKPMM
jgi:hypothetical protein